MSELLWPDDVQPSATDTNVQDSNARSQSAITGVTRIVGRPGSRLKMSMQFRALTLRKRALLRRMIAASRGGSSPFLIPDYSYVKAGSMSVTDLVSTPTFASGTTGFTAGSAFALTVSDSVVRATRGRNTAATDGIIRITNAVTVTQYQPYVGRAVVLPVRGPSTGLGLRFGSTAFGAEYSSTTGLSAGYLTHAFVPVATTTHFGITQSANAVAGDSLGVSFLSLARCALVDNAPNALLQSEDFSVATWNKTRASISANTAVGPDGATTMDSLIEDGTASATHYTTQTATKSAADQEWTGRVYAKANTRTEVAIQIGEVSTNFARVIVNLSTGAVISTNTGSGTVSLGRAVVVDVGNGVYEIAMTAMIPSSITTTNRMLVLLSSSGSVSYSGDGASGIYIGGASYAASSLPMRYAATTSTAAASGTAQDLGGGLYTKGWPASTDGLLLAGDQVEIGGQLQILTGPVNTDAAGRAWLPIPSIRRAPADKTPVIINRPMARWIPQESENGWTNAAGAFSDAELQLIEAA